MARWWDGTNWQGWAQPPAQVGAVPGYPPAPQPTGTGLAVLAHLGIFIAGIIVALVVRLTVGERHAFTRHHAVEALNWQIFLLMLYVIGMVIYFATFLASMGLTMQGRGGSHGPPAAFFASFGVFGLLWLAAFGFVGFAIYAAVAAGQGRWYRYPMPFRLVRGSMPAGYQAPVD